VRHLRVCWRFLGGVGHCLLSARTVEVCSRRGDGQTKKAAVWSGVVEGLAERCWSAEGEHSGWSRAWWEVGGGSGSCFCLCCYWASRAGHLQKYAPRAWRASVALVVRNAAIVVPALARVSHCGNETFSGAPQPAALLCRLPCCATTVHLRS
jgi:hypothetical protein